MAWRPALGSSLVLRASYGLYRSTNVYLPIASLLAQQPPFSTTFNVKTDPANPLTLANGFTSAGGATAFSTFAVDPNLRVATAHIKHLNPLSANTGEVLRSYRRVLVPEMNMGQLVKILRAEFLVDCESYTKVDGLPIFTRDMMEEIAPRC